MTEVIEVQAEVIAPVNLAKAPEAIIEYTLPTAKVKNLKAITDFVEQIEKFFADVKIDINNAEQVKQLKDLRADINKVACAIDGKRKGMDKEVKTAIGEADNTLNALRDRVKEVYDNTGKQIEQARENKIKERTEILHVEYEGCAGAIAKLIPFDKIVEQKWLNPSTRESAAKKALTDKMESTVAKYETLIGSGLRHKNECVELFCETLDLNAALKLDGDLAEKERKAAEFAARRAEVEQVAAARREAAPIQLPIEQPKPAQEPAETPTTNPVHSWLLHVEFTGTRSLAVSLGQSLKALGITGGTIIDQGVVGHE